MRPLALLALLLLTTFPSWAAPVTLFDGGLQAEVPPTFRAWDQSAISELFEGARSQPSAVFGTPDGETRISLTYTDSLMQIEELEKTRQALRAKIEGGGGIAWLRDEMVLAGGGTWFRLDYDLLDEGKRETIMGTVLRDRLLFLIVTTPVEDSELMGPEIEAFLGSLRLSGEATTEGI